MREVYLKIYGIVQGVNFRYHALKQAQALGLAGWVRNLPDSTVEAVAQGEKESLLKFINWCREGPDSAQVEKVEEHWREPQQTFTGFEVRY